MASPYVYFTGEHLRVNSRESIAVGSLQRLCQFVTREIDYIWDSCRVLIVCLEIPRGLRDNVFPTFVVRIANSLVLRTLPKRCCREFATDRLLQLAHLISCPNWCFT